MDQTLKLGSREHLEQIPAVTVTFVQVTFVQAWTGQDQNEVRARSRKGQGKVNKVRSSKVKAKSGQGQSKVKGRSRQVQGNVKAR